MSKQKEQQHGTLCVCLRRFALLKMNRKNCSQVHFHGRLFPLHRRHFISRCRSIDERSFTMTYVNFHIDLNLHALSSTHFAHLFLAHWLWLCDDTDENAEKSAFSINGSAENRFAWSESKELWTEAKNRSENVFQWNELKSKMSFYYCHSIWHCRNVVQSNEKRDDIIKWLTIIHPFKMSYRDTKIVWLCVLVFVHSRIINVLTLVLTKSIARKRPHTQEIKSRIETFDRWHYWLSKWC